MVARAVKSNPSASQDKIASVVCDVEDAIFAKFRNPNRLYKYQCRYMHIASIIDSQLEIRVVYESLGAA